MKPGTLVVVTVALALVASGIALPLLGGGFDGLTGDESEPGDDRETGFEEAIENDGSGSATDDGEGTDGEVIDIDGSDLELVSMAAPSEQSPLEDGEQSSPGNDSDAATDGGVTYTTLAQETEDDADAVEAGVEAAIELVQAQGVEVSQEQETAALEGASASAAQHQEASAEQVQAATTGSVSGALLQEQRVDGEQIQYAVGGATDGALSQYQTANATQLQHAAWGATHGAIAQEQRVTVEQLQVAAAGGAAGAASEAGEQGVDHKPTIQEAAQGAAYGVLEQYQTITAEQRQQITLEHVQHAAAGAAAGAVEGSTEAALTQDQRIDVEQGQMVDFKQVQKAAKGAAKGALEQRQDVTVEQTQSAAWGASAGTLKQVQSVDVEQVQRASIGQLQEAAHGAAHGAISQSQEATVEQIQAAADGAAHGALVQHQAVSITQVQYAATGAAKGALETAVQEQIVEVEQIQAAAWGASEGTVTQTQVVDVTQVQQLARGGAGGALLQHQEATVEQLQFAAKSACEETARVVQDQRISVTQLQILAGETAADATAYAVAEGITDELEIVQYVEVEVVQNLEEIDELEGTASISISDQESDGETVVVDQVDLSEGGFVAIYGGVAADVDPDALLGASGYLEPGEHEDLEIELDEPLEESGPIVAAAHHDTTGDETFQYAETDGTEDEPYVTEGGAPVVDGAFVTVDDPEPEPEATLSVADQEGDGETLLIDEANASVDSLISAEYDGERVDSEVFDADESVEAFDLTLEPALEDDATVDVSVRDAETDDELASETIAYTFEEVPPDPSEPEASLSVADQDGDGELLFVDEASASVDSLLTVTDADGERIGENGPYTGNETISSVPVPLDPALEGDATLEVAVVDAADDEVLESESIEYTLEEEPPEPPEPEATLEVSDQAGDGESVVVDEASATVPYALAVTNEAGEQLGLSIPFTADETVENESIGLDPALEDDGPLEVSVVSLDGLDDPGEADEIDGDEPVLASETLEYTIDPTPPAYDVEFVTCQQAEITGEFEDGDSVIVATGFYESGGFGNTLGEYGLTVGADVDAPLEGTISFEIGEDFTITETDEGATVEVPPGDFGAAITGIASPEAIPGEIDHPNPDASDCIAEVRPELPEITVLETEPGEDAIDVTFGYENPNDAALFVGSEFVEGTTADDPIEELEAGTGEFTAEWTPETDDERLVWAVDMSFYEYDEVLTAETPPAGEIDPPEPDEGEFAVSIVDVTDPVTQGDPLEVDAELENVGEGTATQNVTLAVDDDERDVIEVSLEPGDTESVTLTGETDDLEPGEYPISVSSEDETAEGTVTIEPVDEAGEFVIVDLSGPSSGVAGEGVTVAATITNAGDGPDEQTVTYSVDDEVLDEETVELDSGGFTTVTFSSTLSAGESTHTVSTDDDEASLTIEGLEVPGTDEVPADEVPGDDVEDEDDPDEPDDTEPDEEVPPPDDDATDADDPDIDDEPPEDEDDGADDEAGFDEPTDDPDDEDAESAVAGTGGDSLESGSESGVTTGTVFAVAG
ncbi:DUF7282 domain-containing protein [Natrarchaeobaculum sulfurireducens]|uniref:FHA domain protein n=1 Tax=Natrarchaeobaculum sulfurireducens TaxID=2044521 RepID=A0A346PNA1_9EURY|nr:CARDB domain-containing protein [Natrarchaeobaculum sulfurireducens]AXR80996.1 FHA domain protein [Natrarchaeobaculum sulfurireducens]